MAVVGLDSRLGGWRDGVGCIVCALCSNIDSVLLCSMPLGKSRVARSCFLARMMKFDYPPARLAGLVI